MASFLDYPRERLSLQFRPSRWVQQLLILIFHPKLRRVKWQLGLCFKLAEFLLTCGVCINILESSSRSSRSSLSTDSSKSSSSGMSFSVMQELVSLVTANFAPFGQRNAPDWSFEQQKLFRIGDPPQKPRQGPCFPLQSKRQFFSLFSSQSGTFIGFSELMMNYCRMHWKCNWFWISSYFILPGVMQ